MPVEHWVEEFPRIVRVRRWGPVRIQDDDEACRRLREDPRFEPGMSLLVDCRDLDAPDDVEAVKTGANRVLRSGSSSGIGRVSFLVASEAEYGMARMFGSLTDPALETEVFRDLDRARAWLLPRRPEPPGA